MSAIANSEGTSALNEKPAMVNRLSGNEVNFPRFPDPTDEEFEDDISDEERTFYKNKFADLEIVKSMRLHCSSCDRHLGSSTRNECRMRAHPMLRTLVCNTCHTFYNSGEFEKGDDGSELYCRWCGQGGQVYCCSDCPHVFCAKCIKRNLGTQKIKEIENADDWKCFKCNPRCLWDLRALCWALLRYCDLKNKITSKTEDLVLRETYLKDCLVDYTECCKNKGRRKEKVESTKKKEDKKSLTPTAVSKIPSTIQVKKFASINLDEPKEKKAPKRPSNENKVVYIKNPIAIAPQTTVNTVGVPPPKKPRTSFINPVRFAQPERKSLNTYTRIRPKLPTMPIPIIPSQFNGFTMNNNSFHNFTNMVPNDTLNLSLESLTQGLDMVAVASMSGAPPDDDVVCTPDFPLEPLCEVTEDNTDDDVQCITPGPVVAPKNSMPPLVPRNEISLPDLNPDNIVQMTENDVTVNAITGGLKFRVDPQTLSSNKMYRLPDGRIFAIKANPNMPGGYSATIVAVTETGQAKVASKGATYAAKLSAVTSSQTATPNKSVAPSGNLGSNSKRNSPKASKVSRGTDTSARECDLQVPVEWYRYNLVDAVDALEYSLNRLQKLKKEATCRFLRTRSIEEMKSLHRTLDRLLNTSATRFQEIKDNLNKDLKTYIMKKTGGTISDDDDDVEILPDQEDDDPIYIDENSVESNSNDLTFDLTGVGGSDQNDSGEVLSDTSACKTDKVHDEGISSNKEKSADQDPDEGSSLNNDNKITTETENSKEAHNNQENGNLDTNKTSKEIDDKMLESESKDAIDGLTSKQNDTRNEDNLEIDNELNEKDTEKQSTDTQKENTINGDSEQSKECDKSKDEPIGEEHIDEEDKTDGVLKDEEKKLLSDDNTNQDCDGKNEDTEMSEEMIENLLCDDNTDMDENMVKTKSMEVV